MLDVSPWLGSSALEGRLKTACSSPRILHLATHGFFLPDPQRNLKRESRRLGFDFGELTGAGRHGPGHGSDVGKPDAPLGPGAGRG